MTPRQTTQHRLAAYLARIERFNVRAKDPVVAQQIERLLNGYDRAAMLRELPHNQDLRRVMRDAKRSDAEVLDVIDPLVSAWAVTVLSDQQFEGLHSLSVRFAARPVRPLRREGQRNDRHAQ